MKEMEKTILAAGEKKTIIVNRHHINSNKKKGTNLPPLTVRCGNEIFRGHSLKGFSAWKIDYEPEKPLNCGATLWVTTTSEVQVILNDESDSNNYSQLTLDSYSHRQ